MGDARLRPVDPAKSRPLAPLDDSKERLRAELLLIVGQADCRNTIIVNRILERAMQDPMKNNVKAWVEKYMLDPRLKDSVNAQDLRLLVRRHDRMQTPLKQKHSARRKTLS